MTALQQVAEQGGEEIDLNDNSESQSEARDFEAEARDLGWRPETEFRGDKKLWVDAETFVKRGEEMMPILKSQLKSVKTELAELRRQSAKAQQFFSNAEQRGYERAVADLKAKGEAAAEVGDTAGVRAAMDEMAKLNKPEEAKPQTVEPISKDDFVNWRIDNAWYGDDKTKTMFADAIGDELSEKNGGTLTKADFAEISRRVEERFKEAPKARSAVEGATARTAKRGEKTFADLPADAQRACDKWVKSGIIKNREDYLKSYQWD